MFRKLAATVAVSTALMTTQAWALGLGELKTESGLNQPLDAEIVLLSSKAIEEDELRAKIASFEAYERYGVIREPFHSLLRFEVYTKADGSKALRVFSDSPIREPYVNIIVELNWPQGKLMREYTVLLDPPVFNKTSPVIRSETTTQVTPTARPATPSREVERQQEARPTPGEQTTTQVEETTKPVSQPTTQRRSAPVFEGNSWTVGRGQTLWSIASQVRPDNATVQQTLIALYRSNPDAFINGDVNRLKAGSKLSVPNRSYIDSISYAEALSEYRASINRSQAPLDVRKTVEETNVAENSSSQGGRLSISSVEESSLNQAGGSETQSESVQELENEVNTLREAVETLKLQNQQLKAELEAKEAADDSGVQIQDDALAVLAGSAEKADEAATTDELTVNQEEESASSQAEVADSAESQPAVVEEKPQPKPVAKTSNSRKDEAFYEADGFWYWVGGGFLAVFALAGGLVYWRNRQPPEDSDDGLIPSFGGSAKAPSPTDSFLSKDQMFVDDAGSDPLGEADILIARGKLSEAIDVLEAELDTNPDNDAVRVKYLEVLASQKDSEKFHQVKAGLSQDFDHDSKLGLKVASLTALVGPETTVEPEGKASPVLPPDEDDVFGGLDEQEADQEVDVDLTEELEEAEEPEVETTSANDPLEFDLSDFEKEVEETADQETVAAESISEESVAPDNSIEFSLDSDDEDMVTEESELATESGSSDLYAEVSEDEVQTKLELAKAYLEMGDEESAKDILQEVQEEGNQAQSQEASELLAKL